ncbi:MAG: hypothetical protein G8D88_19600 [gamma proteobacterium symbiont of Ctena orbiculata]
MTALNILSIAAASRRVGYVFLINGKLKDWRISEKAARSSEDAAYVSQQWINELKPEVVVTEKLENALRKGDKTKAIIAAIARTADHNYLLDVSVERSHEFKSKYEEAVALAKRYPEVAAWVPKKRRFFDNEPRNTVIFEALSLAEIVLRGKTDTPMSE